MNRRNLIIIGIIALNVILDQISKVVIRANVSYNETINLIGDLFIMTKVENEGAFLSAGANLSPILRDILLMYLPALFMLFVMGYVLYKPRLNKWLAFGLSCMAGGGIGNLIDRFAYGSVTDFLHIDLGIARTGVFNVADMSIMLGGAILLILTLRKVPAETPEPGEETSEQTAENPENSGAPSPSPVPPASSEEE